MIISKTLWGQTPDGKKIYKYRMTNTTGAYVELTNIGACITTIAIPDRDGELADVVLGFDNPLTYIGDPTASGKTAGRFANRIAKGQFVLDGKTYQLPINNGPNSLHGGPEGFQNQIWESRVIDGDIEFLYDSPDGDCGYPGNLKSVVRYHWGDDNALTITFTAETDAPTVINLINHAYFNLDGEGCGDIKEHVLKLNASEYLISDEWLIPSGEIVPAAGTPMDFANEKPLGRDLFLDFPSLNNGKGYDATWVIDGYQEGQLQSAAELYSPKSGRALEVLTTQPGVHVYTGNFVGGSPGGKNGHVYQDYGAVAIECQHFPNSPNIPEFPSTVLRPGETYQQAVIYAFSVR